VFEEGVEALRIADAGAEIIAGAGCIAESVHQVRCVGLSRRFFHIKLVLGDGNDSASLDDFGGAYGNAHVDVHGGSGDDLIGAASAPIAFTEMRAQTFSGPPVAITAQASEGSSTAVPETMTSRAAGATSWSGARERT
jgi:hypothetical protein